MFTRNKRPARLAAAIASSLLAVAPLLGGAASAQPMRAEQALTRSIVVPKDKSVAYRLDRPAGEIVVAQPEMLQLVATTDQSFYVRGKAPGVTNILVYDRARRWWRSSTSPSASTPPPSRRTSPPPCPASG
jgi:pilus assembly protein CpaC